MRTRRLDSLILAALVGLAIAGWLTLGAIGCQKREQTQAETAPATVTETAEGTTTTTTTTTTVVETTNLTADPVVASQRNATVRRSKPRAQARRSEAPPPADTAEVSASRAADAEVPAGTILRVAFNAPISTATAKVGDTVSGELLDDLIADDGSIVARSGSKVTGKVEHVVDSGRLARPAELRFRLTDLETRSGTRSIATPAYQRTGDTHTKRNVGYIAGGAAVGAIIGQVLGKDTEGTLTGAAAGAAAGAGVAAATGEKDFVIEAGRTVAFTLEEPLRA
jgi:hypothetical protein